MRKSLLIGLIVAVLALGGIGAAFARADLNILNVGNLNQGSKVIPHNITVDKVEYYLDDSNSYNVDKVGLSFNASFSGDLFVQLTDKSGSPISGAWVRVDDGNWTNAAHTYTYALHASVPVASVYDITVVIAEH